jgi:uncharacterized protein YjbI with pentapeptide repeats
MARKQPVESPSARPENASSSRKAGPERPADVAGPGAELDDVDLSRARLHNVALAEAQLDDVAPQGARLTNADLSGASLDDVSLAGARVHNADASKTRWSDATLRGGRFEAFDLREVELVGCRIDGLTIDVLLQQVAETRGTKGKDGASEHRTAARTKERAPPTSPSR